MRPVLPLAFPQSMGAAQEDLSCDHDADEYQMVQGVHQRPYRGRQVKAASPVVWGRWGFSFVCGSAGSQNGSTGFANWAIATHRLSPQRIGMAVSGTT